MSNTIFTKGSWAANKPKVVRNNNYTFYTKKESAGLFGEFNYEYDQNGVFLRSCKSFAIK